MSALIIALLYGIAPLYAQTWAELPWGEPLPADAEEEHDLPWAGREGERCVRSGDLILCAGASGLEHAHRPVEQAVTGGQRTWMQTAGLEWRSGYRVELEAPEGLYVERWGQRRAPFTGWESARYVGPGPERSAAKGRLTFSPVVEIEGGEAFGGELEDIKRAAAACSPQPVERVPVSVLYDPSGEARMVRFQGFPPEALDQECLVRALGEPRLHPESGVIELMVSLRQPPRVSP